MSKKETEVTAREIIQGYYNKVILTPSITVEQIVGMIENDLKTLREWDGEEIIDNLLNKPTPST